MSPRYEPPAGFKALYDDVTDVADQPLRHAFKQAGDERERRFAELARVIKAVAGERRWQLSPTDATQYVVRRAINRLPEQMSGRAPKSPPKSAGNNAWKDAPGRQMAELLYGYRDEEILEDESLEPGDASIILTYEDHYRPAALKLANIRGADSTEKRMLKVLREDLTYALLEMECEYHERLRVSAYGEDSAVDPLYVERTELETQALAAIRTDQAAVLAFYGDVGTGKSRVAAAIATKIALPKGGQVLQLRADDEAMLMGELDDFLHSQGKGDSGNQNNVTLMRMFARLLMSDNAPPVVLIDNAESWKTVKLLLPNRLREVRSVVVVTSIAQILPPGVGTSIRVENMSQSEAALMVTKRLGDVSTEDATKLAQELDGRPLAIEHACTLIGICKPRLDVDDFCSMLQTDMVELLDTVPAEVKLTAIYRRILKAFSEQPELKPERRLLELILLLGRQVPRSTIEYAWQAHSPSGTSDARKQLNEQTLRFALDELENRSLLKQLSNGYTFPAVTMHKLTYEILSRLSTKPSVARFIDIAIAFDRFLSVQEWRRGRPVLTSCKWRHFLLPLKEFLKVNEAWFLQALPTVVFDGPKTARSSLAKVVASLLRFSMQTDPPLDGLVRIGNKLLCLAVDAGEHEDTDYQVLAEIILTSGCLSARAKDTGFDPVARDAAKYPYHMEFLAAEDAHALSLIYPNAKSAVFEAGFEATTSGALSSLLTKALVHRTRGTFLAEAAKWDDAEDEFGQSYALLSSDDSDDTEIWEACLETIRRALRASMKANIQARVSEWESRLSAKGYLDNIERWERKNADFILLCRLYHTNLRLSLSRWYQSSLGREGEALKGALPGLGRLWLAYEDLEKNLDVIGQSNLRQLINLDKARLAAPLNPCATKRLVGEFHGHNTTECSSGEDVDLVCFVNATLLAKIHIPHTKRHDSSIGGSQDTENEVYRQSKVMWTFANTVRERYSLPYLEADLFVAAYALSMISAAPPALIARMEHEASQACTVIGRADRLRIAHEVGSGNWSPVWLIAD